MHNVYDMCPSSIARPLFTTIICLTVKVAVHPSLQSCPVDIRSPDFRSGNMFTVLSLGVLRGLSSGLPYVWPVVCFHMEVLLGGGCLLSDVYLYRGCLP